MHRKLFNLDHNAQIVAKANAIQWAIQIAKVECFNRIVESDSKEG